MYFETELNLIQNQEHEFLLSNKDVANGYDVSVDTVRSHLSKNIDEFIENKHYIVDKSYKNTRKIFWTKKGIVRLGFFIKSERAKKFRDWAEDYIVNQKQSVETTIQIELSKLNQEIKNLKKQLALKEQQDTNPFRGYYTSDWVFRLRENEYAYTRKDWMLLLNECERTLVAERQNRTKKLLTY